MAAVLKPAARATAVNIARKNFFMQNRFMQSNLFG
jgi:hypothetical protein